MSRGDSYTLVYSLIDYVKVNQSSKMNKVKELVFFNKYLHGFRNSLFASYVMYEYMTNNYSENQFVSMKKHTKSCILNIARNSLKITDTIS